MADDGFEFGERMLTKTGFVPSDGPTAHPDPRMRLRLADMRGCYDPPPSEGLRAPPPLVVKREHPPQSGEWTQEMARERGLDE